MSVKKDNPPVPFYLVTGFLGSGKTTFIKRFLEAFADKKRIGIIQNEFAPGQVDGKELRRTGHSFELLEINKGSVFCVCLLSDFQKSLATFIDQVQPDVIIVEATGLADPIAIGEILQSSELRDRTYLAHVWCIVDSVNFLKMERAMTRIRHQVRIADTVILNKSDSDKVEIQPLETKIRKLNPFASIRKTSYCAVGFSDILTSVNDNSVAQKFLNDDLSMKSGGRPNIGAKVIRSTRCANKDEFAQIIAHLATKLYRIKGYVRFDDGSVSAVQSSFGDTHVVPIDNYEGPSELILMGPDLEACSELYRLIFN